MREIARTLKEFVLVAVAGVALGLVANAQNPKGLTLRKNYFDKTIIKPALTTEPADTTRPTEKPNNAHSTATHTSDAPPGQAVQTDPVNERLRALGLQPVSHEEAVAVYEDPFYGDGIYIFVDSRDDETYAEGHIPRAHHLDHYYAERYLDEVLEACRIAEKIVVYCKGGECDDSELAAVELINHGVPRHKVFVYTGGMDEWTANHMPVEAGERCSGDITGGSNDG